MGDPTLPIPQMGQLPSPLSGGGGGGYLEPSSISPHGPRGSYAPRSGGGAGGSYSLQQQQQQDYAEMMQRADMLQLQQQGGGQGGSGGGGAGAGYEYDLYSTVPVRYRSPLSQDDGQDRHDVLFDFFPPTPPLRVQPSSSMPPSHASQYYPSHESHGLPPLPHSSQQQQDGGHPSLHNERSFSHSHSVPHTPHRALHHQASHGHLSASAAQQQQQQQQQQPSDYSDPYGQQNYTHVRDPSMMDPRNGGGWQTPHHHLQQQEAGGAQGTPAGMRQGQQRSLYAAGDDRYAR